MLPAGLHLSLRKRALLRHVLATRLSTRVFGALLGAVTGALIGAAIFAAAGLLIAGTGGLATVAVLALGTAGTMAMGGVISRASGAVADFVDSVGSMDGPISTASSNVYIEGKQAARAIVDMVACTKHSSPQNCPGQ